ncbi:MAG: gamma-glutamyl-gamma-aminobutyrate hydrolase family protein [Dehalococcoidales bacterium]|nr:gamma-glutamyl-gamma-aminobutyrate hydrolase family protein [Dehalococcoidales bacterium]
MSTVWVLQHVQYETLGSIAGALETCNASAQTVRIFEGEPAPREMGNAAGLVVMGGPMGVYEQPIYPFLREEMHLIEQALNQGKPVLGVCLGSQLLAATLGAEVTKGKEKEIGWHQVTLTDEALTDRLLVGVEPSFTAFHWHGDIFKLPRNAVSLASSQLTEYQAFRCGQNAYGVLFHMEVTESIIRDMVAASTDYLAEAHVDGREIIDRSMDFLPRLQEIAESVFGRWASLVQDCV